MNLVGALRSTVRHHGPRPAMLDASRSYNWFEFGQRVARVAGMLRALGVDSGNRFGIVARNGFRHEELKWAGFWLGAIPVPVNFRLAPPEIAQILEDAHCAHVMVESAFAAMLEHPALAGWRRRITLFGESSGDAAAIYEALLDRATPLEAVDPDPDADALLLYTGGTTGRSKGVRLSHRNILANNVAFGLAVGARPEHVYLHAAPMFHSADLLAMGWFLQGAPQCYLPMFSPPAFLAAVASFRVGAVVTVPTMLIATLSTPAFAAADISSLRVLIYGGAPMPLEWIERVAAGFPDVELFNCYGLTESAPDLTIFNSREFRAAIERMRATGVREGPLLSVGKPNALNELRVVTSDGREVETGAAGELIARGSNIMKGYHERPEETQQALRDGWLRTGDVARIDEEGYVYLLDRLKDMVITGGENVYSSEVEAVLHRHAGVAEAAVVGMPDARLGEIVTAMVVAKPGARPTVADIEAHCRASLGGFKVPRRVVFVEQLPKSAMGKVLKGELRQLLVHSGEGRLTRLEDLVREAAAPDAAEAALAMARADEIRAVALGSGVDVVGIAPVARWNEFVPEGARPSDILPGAKSVVVVGVRGPSAGAWQSPDHRLIEMNGYDFANDRAIHIVADHIEREYGFQAIQAPGLPIGGHQPAFSMMLAAVLSGLGTRSFAANIVLNPKYGLLYYSACITTLEVPPDLMLEQDVCPAPMCVTVYKAGGRTPCQAACPSDDGGCLHGTIGPDNRIESTYYDRERCVSRAMNFGINSFQKGLEQIANEDDPENRRMMIHSDFFTRSASAIAFYKESVAQCFECMRVCPIGRAERKLK